MDANDLQQVIWYVNGDGHWVFGHMSREKNIYISASRQHLNSDLAQLYLVRAAVRLMQHQNRDAEKMLCFSVYRAWTAKA